MKRLTYVHVTMSHRPDDRNVTRLLQRQNVIMVLKQNDRLLIQVSRNLHSLGAVDELVPFVLRRSRVRILKETHFELDAEQPRDSSVDHLNIKFAGLDKLGNFLEVAIR